MILKDRNFIDFNPEMVQDVMLMLNNEHLISAVDFWSMNPELALESIY